MALFGRLMSTFPLPALRFIAPAFSSTVDKLLQRNDTSFLPRLYSQQQENETNFSCHTFSDVLALIENERAKMCKTNPLFPLLRDESIPVKQRMAFAPYMLYFSLGCPDVLTYWMKIDKPEHELNEVEKRINTFVNEDNFHYNFYLRDLETLGWSPGKFGSTSGILRHVWATESSAVRILMYTVVSSLRRSSDPLVGLTVVELLEAGLYDLFTIVYKHIAKAPKGTHDDALQHRKVFMPRVKRVTIKENLIEENGQVQNPERNQSEVKIKDYENI